VNRALRLVAGHLGSDWMIDHLQTDTYDDQLPGEGQCTIIKNAAILLSILALAKRLSCVQQKRRFARV
jgi:hypothetical protein